jgi:hypothetical protein
MTQQQNNGQGMGSTCKYISLNSISLNSGVGQIGQGPARRASAPSERAAGGRTGHAEGGEGGSRAGDAVGGPQGVVRVCDEAWQCGRAAGGGPPAGGQQPGPRRAEEGASGRIACAPQRAGAGGKGAEISIGGETPRKGDGDREKSGRMGMGK